MNQPHDILETTVSHSGVEIKLINGTKIRLSSNKGYVYLSFSSISPLDEGNFLQVKELAPNGNLANYISIVYKPNGDN